MFLFCIPTAVDAMVPFDRVTSAEGNAARLAGITQDAPQVRVIAVLSVLTIDRLN